MTGFLEVVLRGVVLSGLAVGVGGVVFVLVVLRPVAAARPLIARSLALITCAAGATALAQALLLALQAAALDDGDGWPIAAMAVTTYVRISLVSIAVGAALAVTARAAGGDRGGRAWTLLPILAGLLLAGAAGTSHAAGRLEHRAALFGLDGLHQLAAAVWIGGLVHLTAAAFGRAEWPWPVAVLRRFSTLAVTAVGILVAAGVGLTLYYVGRLDALVGTSYGFMILTKALILGGLLVVGAMNFIATRRLPEHGNLEPLRIRGFIEAEAGLGLTVLFAASSLTAMPPAVDIVADRATPREVAALFLPKWPRVTSPPHEELPADDRAAPRTDADRAWSEYNHNVAGLFVLAMGLLAVLQRVRWGRWARHWPLVFLGLAAFLLVRNDPGAWPLGPLGFWESAQYPEVLQHRLFVLLVIVFGLFEWRVRTGRFRSRGYALVFPLLCAVGSALLITHSHALSNLKTEFLTEALHAPLAAAGLAVAWGRWLELRLSPPDDRVPGWLWPGALTLVGVLLIFYRET